MSISAIESHASEAFLARLGRGLAGAGLLPLLLVIVVVAMSLAVPNFYGVVNILNILRNASFLTVVATGQALVLIAGGFDLSVGATIALASVVAAKVMAWGALAYPGQPGLAIAIGSPIRARVVVSRSVSSTGSASPSSRSAALWLRSGRCPQPPASH